MLKASALGAAAAYLYNIHLCDLTPGVILVTASARLLSAKDMTTIPKTDTTFIENEEDEGSVTRIA